MTDEIPPKMSDIIQKALEDAYRLGYEAAQRKTGEFEAIVRVVAELPIHDIRGRNVCPCCGLETQGDRNECCDECPRTWARKALGLDGAG